MVDSQKIYLNQRAGFFLLLMVPIAGVITAVAGLHPRWFQLHLPFYGSKKNGSAYGALSVIRITLAWRFSERSSHRSGCNCWFVVPEQAVGPDHLIFTTRCLCQTMRRWRPNRHESAELSILLAARTDQVIFTTGQVWSRHRIVKRTVRF
ncbi:MAG: hypothetical protein ACREXO_12160 [Advenella sp.]